MDRVKRARRRRKQNAPQEQLETGNSRASLVIHFISASFPLFITLQQKNARFSLLERAGFRAFASDSRIKIPLFKERDRAAGLVFVLYQLSKARKKPKKSRRRS
jgi:hypothetical protein